MPRVTLQATIEAQAQELEALKQELAQAKQAKQAEQEQAYIKALAKLDLERKELQAELAQAKQSAIKVTNWYNDKILESQAETSFVQEALEALKLELAQAKQTSFQALASPQEPELEQELAYFKGKLAQAVQELQAEQEKHKQALAREKGLRADLEGTSLQLEQVQAELAQAYEQGEKDYQAERQNHPSGNKATI